MRIIHFILGNLILFFDWLTTPRGIKRSPERQAAVAKQCGDLTLFQYRACPFCVKVRRTLKRLSLPVALRDPKREEAAKLELVEGSGKLKCPCLKIDTADGQTRWMFESKDIIIYLNDRFSES